MKALRARAVPRAPRTRGAPKRGRTTSRESGPWPTCASACCSRRAAQLLELFEGPRPVPLQETRERTIREELSPGLAGRAVVAFVCGVADPLHWRTASRARFALASSCPAFDAGFLAPRSRRWSTGTDGRQTHRPTPAPSRPLEQLPERRGATQHASRTWARPVARGRTRRCWTRRRGASRGGFDRPVAGSCSSSCSPTRPSRTSGTRPALRWCAPSRSCTSALRRSTAASWIAPCRTRVGGIPSTRAAATPRRRWRRCAPHEGWVRAYDKLRAGGPAALMELVAEMERRRPPIQEACEHVLGGERPDPQHRRGRASLGAGDQGPRVS